MTQNITLFCYGDTDWFSCSVNVDSLRRNPRIFGTHNANPLIQAAGNWLGTDQWDVQCTRITPDQGVTYEVALMDILKRLCSGTKSFETALSAGHNVIVAMVYRENGSAVDVAPKYGFRFSGSFYLSVETSEEYADAAAMHLPFVVPSLLQDINEGYLHPESPIVQNVVLPNLNQAGQTSPKIPPVSVKFQSFSDKLAAEKLAVVCTVDHDQAQAWASSPQVSLEVIQGISHTPHGPLIFLVWAIQMEQNNGVCIEQFLEPSSLLGPQFEEFATQQRFDFALVNRASGECVRGTSYPTDGVFKETIVLAQTVESFEGTNMELAIDYFVKTTNLNDLLPERLRR